MANYSVNNDSPGAKKVLATVSVPPASSSTFISLVQVCLDPDYVQDSLDGYVTSNVSSLETEVKFNAPSDIKANQLAGQWAFVNLSPAEVRVIESNTEANLGQEVTLTFSVPFSVPVPAGLSVNVRLWEDWYIPSLHTSVQDFAAKFLQNDSSGKTIWTNTRAAFKKLKSIFKNGASAVWVVPVELHNTPVDLVAALDPEYNTTGSIRLLNLAPAPTVVCDPKHPLLKSKDGTALSAAQNATTDSTWISYINSRANDSSVDEKLTEMVYVASSGASDTSSAVTYVTSSVNTTNQRVFWIHGNYLSNSEVAGVQDLDSPSAALCGLINYISTNSPVSYGHALFGRNFTQLQGNDGGLVEVNQTPANRLALVNAGINYFRTVPGQGTFIESGGFTAKKNSSSSGLDPDENAHVVLGISKVWNDLQPVANSIVSAPNTNINRSVLEGQITGYLNGLKAQNIIADFEVSDDTSSVDILAKTARFTVSVLFNQAIYFVELKLVSSFSS